MANAVVWRRIGDREYRWRSCHALLSGKEVPDGSSRVKRPACSPEQDARQRILAAGPSVAATLDSVEDHVGAGRGAAPAADGCVRGHVADVRAIFGVIGLDPEPRPIVDANAGAAPS